MSKRYGNDTIIVPAVLVRPGDPEPHEWRRAHPDFIRVPVTIKGDGSQEVRPVTPGRGVPGKAGLPNEPWLAGFRASVAPAGRVGGGGDCRWRRQGDVEGCARRLSRAR